MLIEEAKIIIKYIIVTAHQANDFAAILRNFLRETNRGFLAHKWGNAVSQISEAYLKFFGTKIGNIIMKAGGASCLSLMLTTERRL